MSADKTKFPDLLAQDRHDCGNAQRLLKTYGTHLKYCPPMRKFLIWDGSRYKLDETDEIRRRTQLVMFEFAKQALASNNGELQNYARNCLNTPRINAAMRELQPLIPVMPVEFDTDPYLLNFLNGTVDLRSGELRPQSPDDLITKVVPHNYQPDAGCPRFLTFLKRIVATDETLVFLLKALGYSLTGVTSQKAMFLCHGPTDTGKTTLLELWKDLLGEYSDQIDIDSLMTSDEDNNSRADLAKLRGLRFAITSETKQGQRLNEAKLKRITKGQGFINAVRKYEDWITFPETHKLWLDCNHRPMVRDTDDSIWNRLVVVPFLRPLAKEEIDPDLRFKPRKEGAGILALAVKQAVLWTKEGLGDAPSEVAAKKDEWRAEMDRFQIFIKEATVERSPSSVGARCLYKGYCEWSKEAGEHPVREVLFAQRMKEMGFEKKELRSGVIYLGIRLRADHEQAELLQTGTSRR